MDTLMLTQDHIAEIVRLCGRDALMDVRVANVRTIEADSDVICTATSVPVGGGPVLPGQELRPHVHINAVGADLRGKTELPPDLLRAALVCPDHVEQALREGECQQLGRHELGPDLGSLVARPESARPHVDRLTVFDSTGFALEDHVALDVVLELAARHGIGRRIRLEHLPHDAVDPYPLSVPPLEGGARSTRQAVGVERAQ